MSWWKTLRMGIPDDSDDRLGVQKWPEKLGLRLKMAEMNRV
jgi:hypothetical protein